MHPPSQDPGLLSSLCHVRAVAQAFRFTVHAPNDSQAFTWLDQSSLRVLSYRAFMTKLRATLESAGIQAAAYAGHSFRRGGASFAFQSGVPLELIKVLGDWRSNAVLLYLTIPPNIRLQSANLLCKAVINTNHTTPTHFRGLGA